MIASTDRIDVRELSVRNDGPTPAPLVSIRIEGLPPGATAVLKPGSFALLPGETRRIVLTVRYSRRTRRTGKSKLVVDGWGATSTAIDIPYECG